VLLKVKGIGKIQDSTIEMKGITVIAGENNTGKSTFGKVLYCMFNAFCNSNITVLNERIKEIQNVLSNSLIFDEFKSINISDKEINQILNLKNAFTVDKFKEIIINSADKIVESDIKLLDEITQNTIVELERYVNFSDTEIKKMIINRYFRNEFLSQINHINRPDVLGEVSLVIKGQQVKIILSGNECTDINEEFGIVHNAIYIDTPFILDDISRNKGFYPSRYTWNRINHRDDLFIRLTMDTTETGIIKEAIVKEKLNNVQKIISTMANGNFIKTTNSLTFADCSIRQPIELQNVSTGMKIFLIIKRLLEQNEIKEQDILIFDEPEIHLHPEWQIKFAEILILLQKEFNLTILLTTHSPYFLNAMEVFGKKYDSYDKCNFYLAKSTGDISNVDNVNHNIDDVYQQMALPFQKLDDIEYVDNE
jgi:predicted ATPase